MLSTPELIIIFLIIMLVYGGTRLPAMGRGLGEGMRQFREGLRGDRTAENVPPVAGSGSQAPSPPGAKQKKADV